MKNKKFILKTQEENISIVSLNDDSSFNAGAMTGDVNLDNNLDILDIVTSVNMIINN